MIGLPEPKRLVEIAHAAGCLIQDREWKQYQRYLSKHEQQHADDPILEPYNFEEFCLVRREREFLRTLKKTRP